MNTRARIQGDVPAHAIRFAGQVGYSTTVMRVKTPPPHTPLPLWAQSPALAQLDRHLMAILNGCKEGRTTLAAARRQLWTHITPLINQENHHVT